MEPEAGPSPVTTAVIRPHANVGGAGSTDLVYVGTGSDERLVRNCRHSGDPTRPTRIEDTRALIRTARDDGVTDVIIDLSRVSWMNSTGVGELVTMQNDIVTGGGRVVFANPSPRVASILAVTQVDHLFRIFASLRDAIAHFAPTGGEQGG